MVQPANTRQLYHHPFFQNFFCLMEEYQAAFVCISKNASTYLKNIAIYVREGERELTEEEVHARIGYEPHRGYLIPVSEMNEYEEKYGKVVKFAVWRDPVERLISTYKWFLMEKNWRPYFNWLNLYEDCSFDRFLEFTVFELGKANPQAQDEHIRKQIDYYSPSDVDYIIHINDLNDFLIQRGIPTLKNRQNETHTDKIILTDEQIGKIKDLYKEDYSLLNHEKFVRANSWSVEPSGSVASFSNAIGMHGSMGKVISLFSSYQTTKDELQKTQAETLLEHLLEKCSQNQPLGYGNGLCGVGAGVEYLLQNHFVEGNADEILSDVDRAVGNEMNARRLRELSIDKGILGIACYLYYRLCYRKESEEKVALNLKIYVIHLIDRIEEAMQQPLTKYQYEETFFILTLLHQLNIFNAKVEKLMKHCDEKITSNKRER